MNHTIPQRRHEDEAVESKAPLLREEQEQVEDGKRMGPPLRTHSISTALSEESHQSDSSNTNTNTNTNTDLLSPSIKKKSKRLLNRAKALPITRTQKRARWVPGHSYVPFLILQWLWHPIALFIRARKKSRHGTEGGTVYDGHHHHHHHHHQHHNDVNDEHTSASTSKNVFVVQDNGGDLFIE